jgi:hypothetical protein
MMTKFALAKSIDPFALSSDGRALLLINGSTFGAVTHEEFLDWCDEQVEETVAASLDFRFRAATVEPSFRGDLWCAVGDLTCQVSRMADGLHGLPKGLRAEAAPVAVPFADQDTQRLEKWLQSGAVATFLGIKTGTLKKWRSQGRGPQGWARVSPTSVMYPVTEVLRFSQQWERTGKRNEEQKGGDAIAN